MIYRRFTTNKHNKILRVGGIVIAFIGADGVGKTTLTKTCRDWLQALFPTRLIHSGKPPSSIITAPINFLIYLMRKYTPQKLSAKPSMSVNPGTRVEKKPSLYAIINGFRSVSLAWDRKRILKKATRLAAQGEIIFCDRYPSVQVGAMDSPRLVVNPNPAGLFGKLYNWLARLEMNLYKQIPPPDIVLRLKVSAETAIKRNQLRQKSDKENDAYLEARHNIEHLWFRPCTHNIYEINTEKSLEETVLEVKKLIWESL
jgi:thymidylate kinase